MGIPIQNGRLSFVECISIGMETDERTLAAPVVNGDTTTGDQSRRPVRLLKKNRREGYFASTSTTEEAGSGL